MTGLPALCSLLVVALAPPAAADAPPADAAVAARADSPCVLDHSTAAGAVTAAYADLRRVYKERLPGPRGQTILERRLSQLVDAHTDAEFFVRSVLRGVWDEADAYHQLRWRLTLDHVLRSRYLKGVSAPHRQTIAVQRSLVSCDQAAVRVAISDPGRRLERVVDMDLIYRAPDWRVYDVTLDGVSLAGTWRSRFRRIYRDGGLAAVDHQITLLAERYGVVLPPPPPPEEPVVDAAGARD